MTLAARRKRDAAEFRMRPLPDATEPLEVIDATTIDDPQNSDEALALFSLYAEPGDVLTVHADDCPTRRDNAWRCRCTPTVLTVGATA